MSNKGRMTASFVSDRMSRRPVGHIRRVSTKGAYRLERADIVQIGSRVFAKQIPKPKERQLFRQKQRERRSGPGYLRSKYPNPRSDSCFARNSESDAVVQGICEANTQTQGTIGESEAFAESSAGSGVRKTLRFPTRWKTLTSTESATREDVVLPIAPDRHP
jgi:hypothetical protein